LIKRITAFLLTLTFVFCILPTVWADGTRIINTSGQSGEKLSDEDLEIAWDLMEQFGPDTDVEIGENDSIVSVNGFPYRKVDAAFNIRSVKDKFYAETDWVDYPFWQPATKYDGNLANMSMIMALCAARDIMRAEDPETFDPAKNVEDYMLNAGFTDIRKDDYSKETSIYTISTAIGNQLMEHEGEEPFTLIAVGVCGGEYKNEWQSNITAGNGELHEGFRSASDLLIDRIAGYIATRGIKGRIKIWISGFSRAAAVANLTAARLTQSGAFPKEDVYGYTFATPAAVLNPPDTGYENIFNILCPTDMVPQVMPAQWGYGRYGKDLWLPVQEFSSLGELAAEERETMIKETFGIDIHYSASLNLRMRLLLSMVMNALRDRDNYVKNIQDNAVKIMQNKNASHILTTMRNLLLSVKDSDAQTHASLDGLINFIVRVFGNAITRTELAAVNRNSGSALLLLFTEHREDAYLASRTVIQFELFEEDTDFTYVMVKGPVELELTIDEMPGWSMTLTEKGDVLEKFADTGEIRENYEFQEYYMERIGDVSIAAIPQDMLIRVGWKAVSGGKVEVRQAQCGVYASTQYPGAATDVIQVNAGDTGEAWIPQEMEGILPEGFQEATWSAADLAGFLGISAPFLTWRILVTVILLALGLVIFLVIRLVSLFFPNRKKNGAAVWVMLAVFCVGMVEAEGAFWVLADNLWIRFIWKFITGAAIIATFFLKRDKNEKLLRGVLPGLATAIAADLLIMWAFIPGTLLYLLGHILLIISFMKKMPMKRSRWIQWGILSLIVCALIVIFLVPKVGITGWAVTIYAPVLFLMVYSVSDQISRIRYAAAFFLVSDILLGAFLTIWGVPMAHILCTILFNTSLMLLAGRTRGEQEN